MSIVLLLFLKQEEKRNWESEEEMTAYHLCHCHYHHHHHQSAAVQSVTKLSNFFVFICFLFLFFVRIVLLQTFNRSVLLTKGKLRN